MQHTPRRRLFAALVIAAVVIGTAVGVYAVTPHIPTALSRAFEFPPSLGSTVSGTLVSPIGATPSLTFNHGMVAVGVLPMPLPQPLARLKQLRNQPPFFLPSNDTTPHARLLLSDVVDANGMPANNSGNQLVIDAKVSPGSAATTMPPFVIPFDIRNGMAFVDVALPIQGQNDHPITVEVQSLAVNDPNGQLFAVLGFQVPAAAPTPTPLVTSTPGGTPSPQLGHCFIGPDCMGSSFPASQNLCCHFTRSGTATALATSWCPPEQFDPHTGQCATAACVACGVPPATPTPGGCGSGEQCGGVCSGICPDGSAVAGKCEPAIFNGPNVPPGSSLMPPPGGFCRCVPDCPRPPTPTPGPCGDVAQCGGTCPFTCSDGSAAVGRCRVLVVDPPDKPGQSFGPTCKCLADCPSPPSPTPGACGANGMCQGTCTATCPDGTTEAGKCVGFAANSPPRNDGCSCVAECNRRPTPTPQCNSVPCGGSCAIVPPCPAGGACPNFVIQGECRDDASGTCECVPKVAPTQTPAPTCATDADCSDDDACTADHCGNGKCEHACICLTAAGTPACCPGPAALCARSCGADASGTCGGTCPSGATCESLATAQTSCRCVSGVGGPCGGNVLAPQPVCAPGLVCERSLPDITGVCVKPTCIPFFTSGCSQTSDCCQPCGAGTRAPCAICNQGTCVGTP